MFEFDTPKGGVERSTRYGKDPETETWYEIHAWTYAGDGSIIPKSKEEVPKEQVPANWLTTTLEGTASSEVAEQ